MTSILCNVFLPLMASSGLLVALASSAHADETMDMTEVRQSARLPVEAILAETPVQRLALREYWPTLGRECRPVSVFFHGNADPESRRVATLIPYLAPRHADRIAFFGVRVAARGKPSAAWADEPRQKFHLKSTPGVLFHRNPGHRLALAQEEYIQADFKEFRTPRMSLWRTCYHVVQREPDKLLAGHA